MSRSSVVLLALAECKRVLLWCAKHNKEDLEQGSRAACNILGLPKNIHVARLLEIRRFLQLLQVSLVLYH